MAPLARQLVEGLEREGLGGGGPTIVGGAGVVEATSTGRPKGAAAARDVPALAGRDAPDDGGTAPGSAAESEVFHICIFVERVLL